MSNPTSEQINSERRYTSPYSQKVIVMDRSKSPIASKYIERKTNAKKQQKRLREEQKALAKTWKFVDYAGKDTSLGDLGVTIGLEMISVPSYELTSLKGLGTRKELQQLNLHHNFLVSFKYLGSQPELLDIQCPRNTICSFYGLEYQPKLRNINLSDNPISRHPLNRVMILIAAGHKTLKMISNKSVKFRERKVVEQYLNLFPLALEAIRLGWLMDAKSHTVSEFKQIIADLQGKDFNNRDEVKASFQYDKLVTGGFSLDKFADLEAMVHQAAQKKVPRKKKSSTVESVTMKKLKKQISSLKKDLKSERGKNQKLKDDVVTLGDLASMSHIQYEGFATILSDWSRNVPQDAVVQITPEELQLFVQDQAIQISYANISKTTFLKGPNLLRIKISLGASKSVDLLTDNDQLAHSAFKLLHVYVEQFQKEHNELKVRTPLILISPRSSRKILTAERNIISEDAYADDEDSPNQHQDLSSSQERRALKEDATDEHTRELFVEKDVDAKSKKADFGNEVLTEDSYVNGNQDDGLQLESEVLHEGSDEKLSQSQDSDRNAVEEENEIQQREGKPSEEESVKSEDNQTTEHESSTNDKQEGNVLQEDVKDDQEQNPANDLISSEENLEESDKLPDFEQDSGLHEEILPPKIEEREDPLKAEEGHEHPPKREEDNEDREEGNEDREEGNEDREEGNEDLVIEAKITPEAEVHSFVSNIVKNVINNNQNPTTAPQKTSKVKLRAAQFERPAADSPDRKNRIEELRRQYEEQVKGYGSDEAKKWLQKEYFKLSQAERITLELHSLKSSKFVTILTELHNELRKA